MRLTWIWVPIHWEKFRVLFYSQAKSKHLLRILRWQVPKYHRSLKTKYKDFLVLLKPQILQTIWQLIFWNRQSQRPKYHPVQDSWRRTISLKTIRQFDKSYRFSADMMVTGAASTTPPTTTCLSSQSAFLSFSSRRCISFLSSASARSARHSS